MTSSGSQDISPAPNAVNHLSATDLFILAAWCGIAGGEIEVAVRLLKRAYSEKERIFGITRHFVWLVPAIDLLLIVGATGFLVLAIRLWPRGVAWLSARLIITLAIFPLLLITVGGSIYTEALLLLAMGLAAWITRLLERHRVSWRRWLSLSVPVLLGLVALQASWAFGVDWVKQRREDGRPLPQSGSPNVLLVVMDTVRADHLSLYGYSRPTTPNLVRLARRGIRFNRARAAAPWTLPSHATMFTGRWPHELGVKWMYPLNDDAPTLAEYLGSLGYATAGFVGNTLYCSYDSGLDRGFTYYRDYVLDRLNIARSLRLGAEVVKISSNLHRLLSISHVSAMKLSRGERKGADVVNQEFLEWLSHRRDPRRPFFAFINYTDAHSPYVLRPGASYRFGTSQPTDAQVGFLDVRWERADKRYIRPEEQKLAVDSYDNCLAYLDEHLGRLIDELERRKVMDQTLVIVTADHGEGFGEHGLFDHGESLYRAEIGVPLLIVLPADRRHSRSPVKEFVSLRDLPATVVDLTGQGNKSPFPGQSLARFWADPSRGSGPAPAYPAPVSELSAPSPLDPNQRRSPAYRGPLVSLAEGDFVYIRNSGDGSEELYNEDADRDEHRNLVRIPALLPVLRQFRDQIPRVMDALPSARD